MVVVTDHMVDEPRPGNVVLHGVGEQITEVEHVDSVLNEGHGKRVVLRLGLVAAVEQHLAQRPHLGVHVEAAGRRGSVGMDDGHGLTSVGVGPVNVPSDERGGQRRTPLFG